MTQHTHRGTCQACGNIQAVNNSTGAIAKHGYTVDWGYFSGACSGSGNLALETERTYTDRTIATLRKLAIERAATTIEQIETVEILARVKENGRSVRRSIVCHNDAEVQAIESYNTFEKLAGYKLGRIHREGEHMTRHADDLVVLADARHGEDLYVAEQLEAAEKAAKAEKKNKPTKASVKREIEVLQREYDKIYNDRQREEIAKRNADQPHNLHVDLPFSLYHYRAAKHAQYFGERAARIEELVELRAMARAKLA